MRKRFFVVDCKTNEIMASVKVGAGMQVVYDNPLELRKSAGLIMIAIDCHIATLMLSLTGYFIRPLFRALMPLASAAAAFGLVLAYVGWGLEKSAKKSVEGNRNRDRHLYNGSTPSAGSWKDPYGLARDTADVPGKKTYYIVDSETNAIVDVKRLGKWGQKWLNLRAKRQAPKTSE